MRKSQPLSEKNLRRVPALLVQSARCNSWSRLPISPQSSNFWQALSSCAASASRIREGGIPVQGPWKSNRKGGHAFSPDGSSGQSLPLCYHPPVLLFSRNAIQHGVLYFLFPRQLHNTSALLVEICSTGLGQGVALGLTLGASLWSWCSPGKGCLNSLLFKAISWFHDHKCSKLAKSDKIVENEMFWLFRWVNCPPKHSEFSLGRPMCGCGN